MDCTLAIEFQTEINIALLKSEHGLKCRSPVKVCEVYWEQSWLYSLTRYLSFRHSGRISLLLKKPSQNQCCDGFLHGVGLVVHQRKTASTCVLKTPTLCWQTRHRRGKDVELHLDIISRLTSHQSTFLGALQEQVLPPCGRKLSVEEDTPPPPIRYHTNETETQFTVFMHFFNISVFHIHNKYIKLFLLMIQP